MALVPISNRASRPNKGHFGTLTSIPEGKKDPHVAQIARKMRRLEYRIDTPNADQDPIRYQWHTRPDRHLESKVKVKSDSRNKHRNWKEQQVTHYQDGLRVNTDDIFDAVRKRIQSPPDHKIRTRIQQAGSDPIEVDNILAHYLAQSSVADPVLNFRTFKTPGCACCAKINYTNKFHRRANITEMVPLPLQHSEYHYDLSPDETITLESLLDRQFVDQKPTGRPVVLNNQSEASYNHSMQKLSNTIEALSEPPEEVFLEHNHYVCQVKDELTADIPYHLPGVLPTKYLAFAPRNPLRHKPPHLNEDDYKSFKSRGRMKYVSFSPRQPELREYTPENSFNMSITPYRLMPAPPSVPLTPVGSRSKTPRNFTLDI